MQKTIRLIGLLFFGLTFSISVFGQAYYPAEKAVLWTDRMIYISGEDILFSGIISSSDPKNILSEVVYVELITPEGQKINKGKFKINENKFEGQLNIQQDILSGFYFLRAYTKWMRNGEPDDYAYVRLKLVNPMTDELLEINDSLTVELLMDHKEKADSSLEITLNKDSYLPGDRLIVSWDMNKTDKLNSACLSIIPSIAKPFVESHFKGYPPEYSQILFYPETRGITVSGKVINKQTGLPLPFHKVSARFKGEKDFISVVSDSSGVFYMALPDRYNSTELFFIAASLDDDEVELLIDQDFCIKIVALSVPPFYLDVEEQSQLLQMAQINQLNQAYRDKISVVTTDSERLPFYGLPNRSVVIDDYVSLDSLEMYFTDLPNAITIRKRNGKRYFSLSGQPELQLYDPLVLVDWIPVDEADRILALNPNRVEKIDMINQTYLHGGIIYGGLISIITRNLDFGGIEFPESGMYLNFDFFSESSVNMNKDPENPFMNTYGWIPDLQSLQQPIEFIAPDTKGDYLLIIQGVDEQGEEVLISRKFKVE